ncbi:MAG: amidase family protein [Pseudomonadales bacterium]|nr:amidase family protein [Pseudomonadales bacterium]
MLDLADYARHDATGLAELIQAGQTNATELLHCALARADALNPELNAIVSFDRERALAAAGQCEPPDAGHPLRGVPFLIKDISAVQGLAQTRGSRLFAGDTATQDSLLTQRLREAGLIIFGKTNTPELCLTITTESALFGPCHNPANPRYSTGGSSGGAAAAVAAAIVPAAHGSDGGGSIRVPASCCGLFGLKPSRGLTVSEEEMGASWSGLSVNHVLTRSVRDSAAFLDILRLQQAGLYPLPPFPHSYAQTHGDDPGTLRIAVQQEHPAGAEIHPDCRQALEKTTRRCRELGHQISMAAPPVDYRQLTQAMITVINAHVAETIKPQLDRLALDLAEAPLETATRSMARAGMQVSVLEYLGALNSIKTAERQMQLFHQDYDIVLSPVLAQPPAELGWLDMNSNDMKTYAKRFAAYGGFAALYNGTGQPSASVPVHHTAKGLPIGIMISAAWGMDHQLLQLARQLLAEH